MNELPLFLLVDDDPDDIMLLRDAIHSVEKNIKIAEAMDGRSALIYLREATALEALPNLVVLDINMPILNGREVIATMKKEEHLKEIPLVVFSTSSYPGDISYCNEYGVELITKPFGIQVLREIAKTLVNKYAR